MGLLLLMFREGMFSHSTEDVLEETDIFSGDQNRIIFQQKKTLDSVHNQNMLHMYGFCHALL